VRVKADTDGRSPIRLRGRGQYRSKPCFALHRRGDLDAVAKPKIGAGVGIVEGFSAGDEIGGYFRVSIPELEICTSIEPIIGPSLQAKAFTADPTSDDVALIGTQVAIEVIEIHELAVEARRRRVGVGCFSMQVEFGQLRKMRNIDAGLDGGAARRADR